MSVTQRKRQSVLCRACVVALSIAMVSGCSEPPKPTEAVRPVKSMVFGSEAPTVRRSYPGSVQASRRAELAFKVSGPLIELPVREGQEVEEGELLAQIDPRDFNTKLADATSAFEQAQATLASMQEERPEEIRRLKARLAADQATLKEASETLRRSQTLFKDRIITQAELDKSRAANDVAQANAEAAGEDLAKAEAGAREEDINAMEAQIRGLQTQVDSAQNACDDTSLKAPFKGVVAKRLVENFEKVEAKQPIIWFQDLEYVEIIINVPENVMAWAMAVMEAKGDTEAENDTKAKTVAVFDALPETEFPLTLKEYSTEADPGTQTYKVTLTMPQPKEKIKVLPGMTCTVIYAGVPEGPEFAIPVTAVYDEEGKKFAWVIDTDTNTVSKQEIQVGDLTGDGIRVLGGLEEGQTIAISGVHFLQPGMEVRLLGPEIGDQLK